MSDYLLQHAYKNVWCNPGQDQQFIIKPAKISSPLGVHTDSIHMWDRVLLPQAGVKFQVYQIGQVHPALLGLIPLYNQWVRCSEMMAAENLIIDLYTIDGVMLPRFDAWILVSGHKDILVAVKEQPRVANLRQKDLFIRLYSNAYFSSMRSIATNEIIRCQGLVSQTLQDTINLQRDYHNYQELEGYATLYWNGRIVSDIVPSNVSFGDILEVVYDATVKQVVEVALNQLETFDSTKDGLRKYLITHAGNQVNGPVIDYRDDIDVQIVKRTSSGYQGVYFHKNSNRSLRMVTHRDYSAPVMHVQGYVDNGLMGWTDRSELSLRLIIRDSGYQRPLVDEHHRIKELYKLPFARRVAAMIGTESLAGIWHADDLENSFYPKIMDAKSGTIQRIDVQEAYGYNAMARLTANSPLLITNQNGRMQTDLSPGLQKDSTIYEFDQTGTLLGVYFHRLGSEYTIINSNCRMIEGFPGFGTIQVDTRYGYRQLEIDPLYTHRFYIGQILNGQVDNSTWQDVTGDSTKYVIANGRVVWMTDPDVYQVAVRSDKQFLSYRLSLNAPTGLLRFSIESEADYATGAIRDPMDFPMGKLDLFLNRKALIENVDYYVNWPEVVIVNKEFRNASGPQEIHVRMVGHCREDMSRIVATDVGFIRYGVLSHNNRFDVRDDKLLRMVVRGRTVHRSQLKFSEDNGTLSIDFVPNGSPYVIENVVVPLRGLAGPKDYWQYFRESEQVDQAVGDYLSLKLPEQPKDTPDYFPDKYSIYSPFSSVVMHDLLRGVISMEGFKGQYSDQDVYDRLQNYTDLLRYDPTRQPIDLLHIAIHPHELQTEIVLDIYQYRFLERAIKVFLNDKVDIARFISIKPTWT